MKKTGFIILSICFLFAVQLLANANMPDGYEYLFPKSGSKYVHPTSTIILRFENITPNLTYLNYSYITTTFHTH